MNDLELKGNAKRGCQRYCPSEITYTFRVGPVPTDYSPSRSGVACLNEHGIPKDDIRGAYDVAQLRKSEQQSSWIEYTDPRGYQRWIEMKLPHFDPTQEPIVEIYPGEHQRRQLREPKSPLLDSSSPKPRTMADQIAPSNMTAPVASVQQIDAAHNTTAGGITTADTHPPNSHELSLALMILFLVILASLARRVWHWASQRNSTSREEVESIFEKLCESKPSKVEETCQRLDPTFEKEKKEDDKFEDGERRSDYEEYLTPQGSLFMSFEPDSRDEASPASFSASISATSAEIDSTNTSPSSTAANTCTPPAEIIVALSTPPLTPKPRVRLPPREAYIPESCLPETIRKDNQEFKRECMKYKREQDEKMRQSTDSLMPHLATRLRVKRREKKMAEDDATEIDPACSYVS